MARLFYRHPAALRPTTEIAARRGFDLGQSSYDYLHEDTEMSRRSSAWTGWRAQDWTGARVRS